MDVGRLKDEILELTVLEGEKGIWEPLWEVNTGQPASRGESGRLVEQALRELVGEGRITFFRRPWDQGEVNDRSEMSELEVDAELASSWWKQLPLERGDVWFMATGAWNDLPDTRGRLPG